MPNQEHKDDGRKIIVMEDEDYELLSEEVLHLLYIAFEALCNQPAENIIASKIAGVLQITAKCIVGGLLPELDKKLYKIVQEHPHCFDETDEDLIWFK